MLFKRTNICLCSTLKVCLQPLKLQRMFLQHRFTYFCHRYLLNTHNKQILSSNTKAIQHTCNAAKNYEFAFLTAHVRDKYYKNYPHTPLAML